MLLRLRNEGEGFRGALGSIRDPDSGISYKKMVERPCAVGVKPHLACDT